VNTIYDEAIKQLKQENIRITPQRVAILEFLASHASHPTAEEIYRAIEVHFPGITAMHPVALTLRQSRIIMQFVNVAARFLIFTILDWKMSKWPLPN